MRRYTVSPQRAKLSRGDRGDGVMATGRYMGSGFTRLTGPTNIPRLSLPPVQSP